MQKLRPWLDHGFLKLDNNTAERSMRTIPLSRENYLFMGSEGGDKSTAIAYTPVETANPTASIRKLGSPTFLIALPITSSQSSTNSCRGVALKTERNGQWASAAGRLCRTLTLLLSSRYNEFNWKYGVYAELA